MRQNFPTFFCWIKINIHWEQFTSKTISIYIDFRVTKYSEYSFFRFVWIVHYQESHYRKYVQQYFEDNVYWEHNIMYNINWKEYKNNGMEKVYSAHNYKMNLVAHIHMNMFSPACHSIHTGLNNEVNFVSPCLPTAVNHINLDRRRNLLWLQIRSVFVMQITLNRTHYNEEEKLRNAYDID